VVRTGVEDDLGFSPRGLSGQNVVQHLDDRLEAIAFEVEHSDAWLRLTDPAADRDLARETLKEIYLEAALCQPGVVNGAKAALSRLPRTPASMRLEEVFVAQADWFEGDDLPLRSYVALGGDPRLVDVRRASPTAFAVTSSWAALGSATDPFMAVGAVYVLAVLTPMLCRRALAEFSARGGFGRSLGVAAFRPPLGRINPWLCKQLVAEIANDHPEAREGICYGLEYALEAFPLPLLKAASARAEASWGEPAR
jgi:hypothetical protein